MKTTYRALVGRRVPNGKHYYPMLSKPDNYNVSGSDHPDVSPFLVRQADPEHYAASLAVVCASTSKTAYERNRRETGISRPSIFSGLSIGTYLGIPKMFPNDIMHLIMNLAALFMDLWCGTIECHLTDNKDTWDWAVLQDQIWELHGAEVGGSTSCLPSSFDHPPHNPAEKINSGYKAWEWLLYLFGLGPGLLLGVLPQAAWTSYCKLVLGVHIIYQHSITRDQLQLAYCYAQGVLG
jgi:hypothetical protein